MCLPGKLEECPHECPIRLRCAIINLLKYIYVSGIRSRRAKYCEGSIGITTEIPVGDVRLYL